MRDLDRILNFLPFAIVAVIAVALSTAAALSGPATRGADSSPHASTAASPAAASGDRTAIPTASNPTASQTASPASPGSNEPAEMLAVHNALRAGVGAPVMRSDDRIIAAAQRHADYLARNNMLGHEEAPGDPGFTGVSVGERLAAQGYTDVTASEVATSFGTGTDGVRSLWLLPYHRLGLMHPHAVAAGWGHAQRDGRSITVGVIVYDFAVAAPDRIRSPAAGQRVQASWDGEESPDVLPAGAARPVGYPVMVVYANARTVELRSARLSDAGGTALPLHLVSQIYERDYVAVVPAAPLSRASRYHVRLELSVAGADVTDEWDFETDP